MGELGVFVDIQFGLSFPVGTPGSGGSGLTGCFADQSHIQLAFLGFATGGYARKV